MTVKIFWNRLVFNSADTMKPIGKKECKNR